MVNLREARKEAGFTQRSIADILKISQQSYSDYENGKTFPDMQTLIAIADCLNVSTDYLLGRSDDLGAVLMPAAASAHPLPDDERELLDLFRQMTHPQKIRVQAYAEGLLGITETKRKA